MRSSAISFLVYLFLSSVSRLAIAEESVVGFLHVREGYSRYDGHSRSSNLDSREKGCTATLISKHVIVTATHCVEEIFANRIRFSLDAAPLENLAAPYAQVTEYKIHPDYYGGIARKDLAVAFLEYGSYGPVPRNFPRLASPETNAPIAWGIGYGVFIDDETIAKRVFNLMGSESYGRYFPKFDGQVTCHGDSGGPLFAGTAEDRLLIGVLSGGHIGENNRCMSDSSYSQFSIPDLTWIKNQVRKWGQAL